MIEITPMRKWMGATAAWSLLWILVFDKWFFWTPIGLFVTFGIPIAGWLVWWNFYRGAEDKIVADGRQVLDKTAATLLEMKKKHLAGGKKKARR